MTTPENCENDAYWRGFFRGADMVLGIVKKCVSRSIAKQLREDFDSAVKKQGLDSERRKAER